MAQVGSDVLLDFLETVLLILKINTRMLLCKALKNLEGQYISDYETKVCATNYWLHCKHRLNDSVAIFGIISLYKPAAH